MENRLPTEKEFIDAAIMAGGKMSILAPTLPNKNFLQIKGTPLFIHVLKTLTEVDRFRRIYIVGPKKSLEEELKQREHLIHSPKEVVALEEGANLVENVLLAFHHSIGAPPDSHFHQRQIEQGIFAVSGDSPLILPDEVNQFLDQCDPARHDYFMGMTPDTVLDRFRPVGGSPGIRMAYTPFVEARLRINNMHFAKPLKVLNLYEFNELYRIRHLRNTLNILRLFRALSNRDFRARDWAGLLKMFLGMWAFRAGLVGLSNRFRKDLSMARVEETVSRLIGASAKIVVTTYGGSALDVDRPRNLQVLDRMFNEWVSLQRKAGADSPIIEG